MITLKGLAVLAAVSIGVTPVASAAQDAPTRAFTGEDLFKLEGATEPQISPDGSRVVYVRRTGDIMKDSYHPSLWLVDVSSGAQRPLVADTNMNMAPRWSPDGRRIAYVSTAGGAGAQLYVLYLDSGTSVRVTGLPDTPAAMAWSRDGRQIAYTMRVPAEGAKLGNAPAKPEGAEWAKPLTIIDRVTYRFDGAGYAKPGYDQLFVVSADGGAPRRVTAGNWDAGGPIDWSADGRRVFFTGNRVAGWERAADETEIYAADLANGAIRALTDRRGLDLAPKVSPDGRLIAFIGADDDGRSHNNLELYVMNVDGSNVRAVTPRLDRSIDDFAWAGNSALFATYADNGALKLARVALDGRTATLVDFLTPGTISDRPYAGGAFSASRNGTLAYTSGGIDRPGDLFVKAGGAARQLTRLNTTWLEGKDIAPMRKLAVRAPDGRLVDAWLIEPIGRRPGQKIPLILEIHGGPHTEYGPGFSTDYQLYAAAGYAVLYTNPRGSTSYGEEFANLIDKNYPGPDYDDLIAAVDAAIADGVADEKNLFVTGGSGGGVLTAWIVGKTDRFAAAATQKPVINWTSEVLTADLATAAPRYWFGGMPWEKPEEYWRRSPLSLVGNVKTPTLVVVGEQDYRTPMSEAAQYYQALQLRGVPTAFVTVPEAGHGITARPSQSAAKASAIIAWFDRYRTDKAKPAAPAIAGD